MHDDLDRALDNLEKGLKSAEDRHIEILKRIERSYRNLRIALILILFGGFSNIGISFWRLYNLRSHVHQVQKQFSTVTATNAVQAEDPHGR